MKIVGANCSVGNIKIKYYVVAKGRGFWRPTPRMKKLGFDDVRCGADSPNAWAIAEQWNVRWQAVMRGDAPAPSEQSLNRDDAELARRYPSGSVGAGFQAYIRTEEWKAKAESTRNKVWWPAWARIRAMWGDVNPNTIAFDQMSKWRADLERAFGRGVAHKTIKTWRSLWNVLLGLKIARGADPSTGIRNRKPRPRHQTWTEGEAVRLAKDAWRHGDRGLACIIAATWDTLFQPGDVRTLTGRHVKYRRTSAARSLWFDRTDDGRIKTGRAAIGTISRRTQRLVEAYLSELGADPLPDAVLFRRANGKAFAADHELSEDFAAVRERMFPGDERKLMDLRRSGTVEAIAGGGGGDGFALDLSAKLANSIDRSNELHKTYAPTNLAPVLKVDAARLRGRRTMRESE